MKLAVQRAFETLGVSPAADETQIRAAYRKLALEFHPDKNPGDANATAKFQEISAAYRRVCSYREHGNNGDSEGDEFDSDCLDDDDFDVSLEEMLVMFDMLFGSMCNRSKRSRKKTRGKKPRTARQPAPGPRVAIPHAKTARRGRGRKPDFAMPSMPMPPWMAGISDFADACPGEWNELEQALMDEMAELLELHSPSSNAESQVEEVSDWDDEDATPTQPSSLPSTLDATCTGNHPRAASPSDDQSPAASTLTLEARVLVHKQHLGVIKFMGPVHYCPGEFVGVELLDAVGKNDGTIKGVRYFACPPSHGLMARPQDVELELPPAHAS